jgi:hypothetical protein
MVLCSIIPYFLQGIQTIFPQQPYINQITSITGIIIDENIAWQLSKTLVKRVGFIQAFH